jgi:predicted O-methyltransferase YrrM
LLATQTTSEGGPKRRQDPDFLGKMLENVTSRYGALANVTIRKGFSEAVLSSYPDDYFDWVYIDGDHSYDLVRRDVELSFDKVKRGGVIAGDDFFWKRDDRMPVREAVFHVLKARGGKSKMKRLGQQFMITVEK